EETDFIRMGTQLIVGDKSMLKAGFSRVLVSMVIDTIEFAESIHKAHDGEDDAEARQGYRRYMVERVSRQWGTPPNREQSRNLRASYLVSLLADGFWHSQSDLNGDILALSQQEMSLTA